MDLKSGKNGIVVLQLIVEIEVGRCRGRNPISFVGSLVDFIPYGAEEIGVDGLSRIGLLIDILQGLENDIIINEAANGDGAVGIVTIIIQTVDYHSKAPPRCGASEKKSRSRAKKFFSDLSDGGF